MKAKAIISAAMLMACGMASAQTKESAVLFSGEDLDNSYLLSEKVSVVFGKDGKANIYLDDANRGELVIDDKNSLSAEFRNAFTITAKQDPDHTGNYYSAFYSGEGAYRIPEGVKAYIGEVEKTDDEESDDLNLTALNEGVIHRSEGVVLKAGKDEILLMPSCNKDDASSENILTGKDEVIETPETGTYGLTYDYRTGMGFYKWTKAIPANKAFLVLEEDSNIKGLRFNFNVGFLADRICDVRSDGKRNAFNLQGVKVGRGYKGMVVENGRKVMRR